MFSDRYLLISFHASWQSSRIFTHSLSAGTVAFKSQTITTTTSNNKKALCKAKLGRVIALVCDGQTIRKKYWVKAGNIWKAWLNIYYYVSPISFSTCTTLEIWDVNKVIIIIYFIYLAGFLITLSPNGIEQFFSAKNYLQSSYYKNHECNHCFFSSPRSFFFS